MLLFYVKNDILNNSYLNILDLLFDVLKVIVVWFSGKNLGL